MVEKDKANQYESVRTIDQYRFLWKKNIGITTLGNFIENMLNTKSTKSINNQSHIHTQK